MSMATRPEDTGIIEVEHEIVDNGAALMALNRSEIDMQVSTAKAYPRSIKKFREEAMEMACMDEETAGTMFYVLPPRKGADKRIEGPSVRLAEVVGSSWGNLRYGARIVEEGEKFVTAQGMCFDLEKNIAINFEVKRSIWGKYGRFSQDMIQVTCAAACSIALRQAIFKVVPRMFVDILYNRARQVAIGKADSTEKRRQKLRDWFKQFGVTEEQLLGLVHKKGFDDLDEDDLVTLRGVATALKDGDTTVDQLFETKESVVTKVKRAASNDKLAAATQAAQQIRQPDEAGDDSTFGAGSDQYDNGPQVETPSKAKQQPKGSVTETEADATTMRTLIERVADAETPMEINQVRDDIGALSLSKMQRAELDAMIGKRRKELGA
jgi:hypothetical protein